MAELKLQTIKRLFAMSGNLCSFPNCKIPIVEESGTVTGEICHIKAQSPKGPRYDSRQTEEERQSYDNLVLLCARHHKIVDAEPEIYDVQALAEMKAIHESAASRPETEQDFFFARILLNHLNKHLKAGDNTVNIMFDSPGAIQGHTINLQTQKNRISVNAPPGTIGSDANLSRYMQHLIKRYNEFARIDPTRRGRFSHAVISKNIEDVYGNQWKLLPLENAADLIEYLQGRISRTWQAKVNKGKGWKSFSTYHEFLQKHRRR